MLRYPVAKYCFSIAALPQCLLRCFVLCCGWIMISAVGFVSIMNFRIAIKCCGVVSKYWDILFRFESEYLMCGREYIEFLESNKFTLRFDLNKIQVMIDE